MCSMWVLRLYWLFIKAITLISWVYIIQKPISKGQWQSVVIEGQWWAMFPSAISEQRSCFKRENIWIVNTNLTKAPLDHHMSSAMLDRWSQALLQYLFICSAPHNVSSLWSKHLCEASVSKTRDSDILSTCTFVCWGPLILLASWLEQVFTVLWRIRGTPWCDIFGYLPISCIEEPLFL